EMFRPLLDDRVVGNEHLPFAASCAGGQKRRGTALEARDTGIDPPDMARRPGGEPPTPLHACPRHGGERTVTAEQSARGGGEKERSGVRGGGGGWGGGTGGRTSGSSHLRPVIVDAGRRWPWRPIPTPPPSRTASPPTSGSRRHGEPSTIWCAESLSASPSQFPRVS